MPQFDEDGQEVPVVSNALESDEGLNSIWDSLDDFDNPRDRRSTSHLSRSSETGPETKLSDVLFVEPTATERLAPEQLTWEWFLTSKLTWYLRQAIIAMTEPPTLYAPTSSAPMAFIHHVLTREQICRALREVEMASTHDMGASVDEVWKKLGDFSMTVMQLTIGNAFSTCNISDH